MKHSEAKIIVSGCAAQIDPVKFSIMPEVDLILGNEEKLYEKSYLENSQKNFWSKDQKTSTSQDKIFFAQKKQKNQKSQNFAKFRL